MDSTSTIQFVLPGAAVRLLREGSPEAAVVAAVAGAERRTVGRGAQYRFTVTREVAEAMADYLDTLAGCVGQMTNAEREGGTEHAVAARAVARIEAVL